MIQQRVMSETRKVKDIHNIRSNCKVVNTDLSTLQRASEHFSKSNCVFGNYFQMKTMSCAVYSIKINVCKTILLSEIPLCRCYL